MTTNGISSYGNAQFQSPLRSEFKQRRQDFQALDSAMQSGDLAGVQKAFASLQQDMQSMQKAGQQQGPNQQNNPVAKDFQALSDALNSGDMSAAQKAYASLKQDMQAARQAHGSHAHHPRTSDGDADDASSSPTSNSSLSVKA